MTKEDEDTIEGLMKSIHNHKAATKTRQEGAMANIIVVFAILRRMGIKDAGLQSIFSQSVFFIPYVDLSDVKLLKALIVDANAAKTKESVNKAFVKLMEIVSDVEKKPVK